MMYAPRLRSSATSCSLVYGASLPARRISFWRSAVCRLSHNRAGVMGTGFRFIGTELAFRQVPATLDTFLHDAALLISPMLRLTRLTILS